MKSLWKKYNKEAEGPLFLVKYYPFSDAFNHNFKLNFKSTTTNACSECIRLKLLIKTQVGREKVETMTKYRIHTIKAKSFYKMLSETKKGK